MASLTCSFSFAFVEYEDRRDADDAYHEMHNKRIGRDDILKIEVCLARSPTRSNMANVYTVGSYPSQCVMEIRIWSRPRPSWTSFSSTWPFSFSPSQRP
jgi:hypothetical protein